MRLDMDFWGSSSLDVTVGLCVVCSDSVWSRIKVEGHVKGLLHV